MRIPRQLAIVSAALSLPGAATAEEKLLNLAADARLEASGLIRFLVPRFALKTGTQVTVLAGDENRIRAFLAAGEADAALLPEISARTLADGDLDVEGRPVFFTEDDGEGGSFSIVVVDGAANHETAARFAEWLASDIGQRTVSSFEGEGVTYLPGVAEAEPAAIVLPEGDADQGEQLSHLHCGRCHVVSEKNRFGGIGSTPSFAALRSIEGWEEKFLTFWALNPHPSFTQVEGITEPFDPARPPHIAPVEISQDELAAIVAFAASVDPKDLGAEIQSR